MRTLPITRSRRGGGKEEGGLTLLLDSWGVERGGQCVSVDIIYIMSGVNISP